MLPSEPSYWTIPGILAICLVIAVGLLLNSLRKTGPGSELDQLRVKTGLQALQIQTLTDARNDDRRRQSILRQQAEYARARLRNREALLAELLPLVEADLGKRLNDLRDLSQDHSDLDALREALDKCLPPTSRGLDQHDVLTRTPAETEIVRLAEQLSARAASWKEQKKA